MRRNVTIRLSPDELSALKKLPGDNLAGKIRALIHHAALVDAVSVEIRRTHDSLAAKLAAPPTGDPLARAALAALIEHDVLPRAAMDRKPQLLNALKGLKA